MEYQYAEAAPRLLICFFTDDSLLFCKANGQECQYLIEILQLYEAASGQKINADKSSVFFSNNTPDDRRCEVLNVLGPMQDTRHKKYLGLPSIIGKSRVKIFAEVKERVEKKLSGWKEKMLSVGGREVLIKAVAQAIPTYTMSCFQIPKSICDDIEGESSSGDARSPLWKKLWHLNIPPKVHIFAWKMCMNALPTLVNFQRRSINTYDICLACGKEPESNFHIFVKCEVARRV